MSDRATEEGNGSAALAKLFNQLNLPTLAAIVLMGGGNIWATKSISDDQRLDILRAVKQIHELHDALKDFEGRQKATLENNAGLLKNQIRMLDNQATILSNQTEALEQLKAKH